MAGLRDVVRALAERPGVTAVIVVSGDGLTIDQAIACPAHGAPLVVLGAPLVIAPNDFRPASTELGDVLAEICREIRRTPLKRR
jgi:3-hexulose-6-phosphate synthase/6-phospho-3-hexuloisomerase